MRKIAAFLRGMWEFRSDVTWSSYTCSSGYTDLDAAYDWGREWAHRITFRRYDY